MESVENVDKSEISRNVTEKRKLWQFETDPLAAPPEKGDAGVEIVQAEGTPSFREAPVNEPREKESMEMVKPDQVALILELRARPMKIKKIARQLGLARNTVRRVIREGHPAAVRKQRSRITLLAPFASYLMERAAQVEYNAWRLYMELQPLGYSGGYGRVKDYIRPIRRKAEQQLEATMRFETGPGQQAQVDFGQALVLLGGIRTRVHIFVMTQGYSRTHYAEGFVGERLEHIVAGHAHAFEWFGGFPDEILYDNPRTIVLDKDVEEKTIVWNPKFLSMTNYYGFQPRLCRYYRAQTKGKVESGVKYIKKSFLPGRDFASLEDLNSQLHKWIQTVADVRIHGTTHEQPVDRMRVEAPALHPLGARPPFTLPTHEVRFVPKDALVNFETNRYSVPWEYVSRQVEVQVSIHGRVQIFAAGKLIAEHERLDGKYRTHTVPMHYEGILRRDRPVVSRVRTADGSMWRQVEISVEIRPLDVYEELAVTPLVGVGV